ncbi:MAG TPA: hypothetical protein VI583_12245 [Cyclobacteriaceae bacterium]|nr:hypothetical protein [Cyclobacteriaceae bacterium]
MENTFTRDQSLSSGWWTTGVAKSEFVHTIRLYQEYRDMVMCDKCLKFDTQFEAVSSLLKTYNNVFFKGSERQLACICDLIDRGIPSERKKILVRVIDSIGYEKIRHAFETLLQASENKIQEEEDLFAILKRHRLHFPEPGSDEEKLYRIGQFLNMALINMNLLKKKNNYQLSEKFLSIKYEASMIIIPLIDAIFAAVLGDQFSFGGISAKSA